MQNDARPSLRTSACWVVLARSAAIGAFLAFELERSTGIRLLFRHIIPGGVSGIVVFIIVHPSSGHRFWASIRSRSSGSRAGSSSQASGSALSEPASEPSTSVIAIAVITSIAVIYGLGLVGPWSPADALDVAEGDART